MVTLLPITMFVRQIGWEGCNSPMGTISMQVLLTDTLLFLLFYLNAFVCHVTPLFAKSSHCMYGVPLVDDSHY